MCEDGEADADGEYEEEDEVEEENVRSSSPVLIQAAAFHRIASPDPVAGKRVLHPFTVLSIASCVIMASKEHASRGVKEMKEVLSLWRDMVRCVQCLRESVIAEDR